MRLTLIAPVPAAECDLADDKRTITGMALPYGVVGRTSAGPVTVKAGAVELPTELRRVKLFREHGRKSPVGYALSAAETATGLTMKFRAAATPDGDTALLEASEGVRDALSVELDDVQLDKGGNVTAARLSAVALVSIPAFADARLVAEDTDSGTDDDDDDDDTDDGADTDSGKGDSVTTTTTGDAGGTGQAGPVGAARARNGNKRGRGLSLDAAMERVISKIKGSPDSAAINAALTDITPANDTSDGAFIRPQWIDELWTPVDTRRPYANSVTKGTLTGMKVFGWKWLVKPTVEPYAGNKAPIPSNTATFGPAEAPAVRHAGGWDVDNIYYYLGDSSLFRAILDAAVMDYAMKQEASISDTIVAEATAATADTFVGGLSAIANTLAASGARPSFIGIAADIWADYIEMPASDAPWWLSSSASSALNLTEGTSAAQDLRVFLDPNLPAQHMVGGDKRAVTFYEPRGNPFRVQSVNLPNGGIDLGVFGFSATLVNDSRGLVDVTVGTVTP